MDLFSTHNSFLSWFQIQFEHNLGPGRFSDCFQTRTLSRKPGRWPCHWLFMPPCAMVIWMMPWWDSLVIGGSGSQVFGLVGVENRKLDTGALMCFLTRSWFRSVLDQYVFFSMDEPSNFTDRSAYQHPAARVKDLTVPCSSLVSLFGAPKAWVGSHTTLPSRAWNVYKLNMLCYEAVGYDYDVFFSFWLGRLG